MMTAGRSSHDEPSFGQRMNRDDLLFHAYRTHRDSAARARGNLISTDLGSSEKGETLVAEPIEQRAERRR